MHRLSGDGQRAGLLISLGALALLLAIPVSRNATAADTVTPLTAIAASADTGEKPQSKVWTYDGRWWAVMPKSSAPAGTWLWRLEPNNTWASVLQLSASTSSHADVKPVGSVAHILLYGGATQLVSVEYVPLSTTYQLWATRPTATSVSLPTGNETASIDIDSTGRMWLSTEAVSTVEAFYSDAPYASFSALSAPLATGINADDISVVQVLPNGTLGVLWSNQNTQRFGFRLHVDGADPNTWSADEVPASASALNVGAGMADDHLNTKVATDGTLYAAVKTSYDTTGFPKIAMLIRRPGGTWDPLYEVDQAGTRGILLLNEAAGTVRVVYTSSEGFNDIIYKESAISAISFGPRQTLITGGVNNATSTKQNWSNEVVILASNASNNAPGVKIVSNASTPTPTNTPVGTATPTNTPAGTSTPTGTPTATNTPLPCDSGDGLVGLWGFEEASGDALDAAGSPNDAALLGSATRVSGGIGAQTLSLPGAAADYARAPDDACLDISGNITLAGWVKPGRTTTTDLIDKAVNGTTNGYELGLSAAGAAADQKVFLRVNQVTSGDTFRVNSTTKYPADACTWIHAAGTYDGANLRIYVNGTLENTVAGVTTIATNALPLGIGNQPDGAARSLLGQLDDVRVYNRALSGAEIAALASPAPSPPCATPTPTNTPVGTATPTNTPGGPNTPTGTATTTPTATNTAVPTSTSTNTSVPTSTSTPGGDPVFVGAGDIADCAVTGDEETALLLDAAAGTVYTLGDNVYQDGTLTNFNNCYDPNWGRHKARTRPSTGNHDYQNVPGASGYFDYFNGVGQFSGPAGDRDKGYYSYNLGTWHMVVLNSECAQVGGCNAGSAQELWLRADLAANPAICTLAYWHKPRFAAGGSNVETAPFFQALYDYGADVVLSGHVHDYQRVAPQNPSGVADPSFGIREFVVGSGGESHVGGTAIANTEAKDDVSFGVLKLVLHPSTYDFQFIPIAGQTFTDQGSGACHGAPSGATPTPTSTATNTPTGTNTPTNTPTVASTATNTAVPTNTPTPTSTSTNTAVPTSTSTNTATPTATNTATNTPTATATNTPTDTPTATGTATNTATATATPSCVGDLDCDGVLDLVDNCSSASNPLQENIDSGPPPPAGNSGTIDNGPGIPGNDATVPNGDNLGNACDTDHDNDGLPDALDTEPLLGASCGGLYVGATDGHLNPTGGDNSNDDLGNGIPAPPMGTDLADDGPSWDTDNDGVLDGIECQLGTNPRDRLSKPNAAACGGGGDADLDGLPASAEKCKWGTSDANTDSDGDGISDCVEANDNDGNGVQNFPGDAINSAKAANGIIGKTQDFDLNGDGVVNFPGDTILSAKMVNHVGGICM